MPVEQAPFRERIPPLHLLECVLHLARLTYYPETGRKNTLPTTATVSGEVIESEDAAVSVRTLSAHMAPKHAALHVQ